MDLEKIIVLAKVLSVAMGWDKPEILKDKDVEIAYEFLKEAANYCSNWSDQQKELYKAMIDCVKTFPVQRNNK